MRTETQLKGQARAIRAYAKKRAIRDLDTAVTEWISHGLAEKAAEYYKKENTKCIKNQSLTN